ncbi:hypothetical protein [Streptomyces sp. Ru62]|uniref:hypothetical protein n=1 Tax=Streptomyces sp. Ru62 TaxID=2080745 RepID=UPI0021562393|nr:hypothetical protein [Streptomyces sp. Ru62]
MLAESLAGRRMLCDLLSAQAGVLEHNVSPEVAARYKRAAIDNVAALAAPARAKLPELGNQDWKLPAATLVEAPHLLVWQLRLLRRSEV